MSKKTKVNLSLAYVALFLVFVGAMQLQSL